MSLLYMHNKYIKCLCNFIFVSLFEALDKLTKVCYNRITERHRNTHTAKEETP